MSEETLTEQDLDRVFIREQDATGKWRPMTAKELTDVQFDAWAKTRMQIQGEGVWSMRERADFCNALYQAGALHILKRDEETCPECGFSSKESNPL